MPKPGKLVIIGGCGHVDLPLGIVFANTGIIVVLLDLGAERIASVNSGRIPFIEKSAEEHLRAVIGKTLVATADSSCLRDADAAIAVVGVSDRMSQQAGRRSSTSSKTCFEIGRLQAGYNGFRKGLNSEMVEPIFGPALWLKKGPVL